MTRADVLMVTYRSAGYLARSLEPLLNSLSDDDRLWLWHNGADRATLDLLESYRRHPRVARFHHSPHNVRLGQPMQWLWRESDAALLSKVDDDCVVQPDWLDVLAAAQGDNDSFGVIGSWRYPDEDFDAELSKPKIQQFSGGHRLLRNNWVQGSGFVCKRRWVQTQGPLRDTETFTQYCVRLAAAGAVNGWYFPFVREDHMDDPRSPNTLIRNDADLRSRLPLSAQRLGVTTVEDWVAQLRRSARVVQAASLDPQEYGGWRNRGRIVLRSARRLVGLPAQW